MRQNPKSFVYKITKSLYNIIASLVQRLNKAARELNYLMYRMDLGERADDIYINSYPKSGTTMIQMILYQLTTDGSMDFDHLDDVSPWIRNEAFENQEVKELKSPRLLKSHDDYDKFDHLSEGRFIYVYRNPMDVALSNYHQGMDYGNHNMELDEYIKDFVDPTKKNWFSFHKEWLLNKKNVPILYLQYEEILNDFDNALSRIIKFCEINPNKVNYKRVKERSSFNFMKQHEDKFGVKPNERAKVFNNFIRIGKLGEGKRTFTDEQVKLFEEILTSTLNQ